MVNEEIIEGLKLAVSKGESLQSAMMSFYNAGYLKQEIEEAANAMQHPQVNQIITQTQQTQPVQQPQQPIQVPVSQIQRVSGYDKKPKSSGIGLTVILIFALVVLFGILVAIFLFKDEISSLLNSIMG